MASRLFHNEINIKYLYSLSWSSSSFCGCWLLCPDEAVGLFTCARDHLIHIYYSDGSWGPPHANSPAYALVRHLFTHTTARCTLQELSFVLLMICLLLYIHLSIVLYFVRSFFHPCMFSFLSLFCFLLVYSFFRSCLLTFSFLIYFSSTSVNFVSFFYCFAPSPVFRCSFIFLCLLVSFHLFFRHVLCSLILPVIISNCLCLFDSFSFHSSFLRSCFLVFFFVLFFISLLFNFLI